MRQLFFLRKNLERIKTQIKQKPNNKIKTSEQKTAKATAFCAHKNSYEGGNHFLWALLLSLRLKLFGKKKKKNWLEMVLIA